MLDAMQTAMQPERVVDPELVRLVTNYNNGARIPLLDLIQVLGSFGFVLRYPLPPSEIMHISFKGGYPVLIDAGGGIASMFYDKATADRIGPLTWAGGVQPADAAQAIAEADAAFADEVSQPEALTLDR